MPLTVSTSALVSCCGEDRGQEGISSRPHSSSRFHEWYRADDNRNTRNTVRSGRTERDRSIARSSEIFGAPSGSRAQASENPDTLVSTTRSRSNATSCSMRARRASTSCCRRTTSISKTSTVTTSAPVDVSQPRAVERGTPRRSACPVSPVDRTRSRSRWSYLRRVRAVGIMDRSYGICPRDSFRPSQQKAGPTKPS